MYVHKVSLAFNDMPSKSSSGAINIIRNVIKAPYKSGWKIITR